MNNLRTFLDVLRREREIVEIDVPVSTDLEIAEIHRRVVASGGPALLFRQVDGSDFPCVTNLFGTPKRVDLAFGRRPGAFIDQLVGLKRNAKRGNVIRVRYRKMQNEEIMSFGCGIGGILGF